MNENEKTVTIEETVNVTAEEKENKKIPWKKILGYAAIGALGYFVGKSQRRYKRIPKGGYNFFDMEMYDNMSAEEKGAIAMFINAYNECVYDNNVILVIDKTGKTSAGLKLLR